MEKESIKDLYLKTFCLIQCSVFSTGVFAGLPRLTIEGVDTDSGDMFAILQQILQKAGNIVIWAFAIIVLLGGIILIFNEARNAKASDEDGRWLKVGYTILCVIVMDVIIFMMLQKATEALA